MPIKLLLIRHGNTFAKGETCFQIGSKTNLPLTSEGTLQAMAIGHALQDINIVPIAVYSGKLLRQQQTAKQLINSFNLSSIKEADLALNEIDYGAWEGLTVDKIKTSWSNEYKAWHTKNIWADNIFPVRKDIHIAAIKEWLTNISLTYNNNDVILAVTSQGIIKQFINFVPGLSEELYNTARFADYKVKTGSYCILSLDSTLRLTIIKWNQIPNSCITNIF